MDAEEISTLGHRAQRIAHGAVSELARLERTPATWADVLLGRVCCAVDFDSLDRVIAELDKATKAGHGDTPFLMDCDPGHTLRGLREYVAGVRTSCDPFRRD